MFQTCFKKLEQLKRRNILEEDNDFVGSIGVEEDKEIKKKNIHNFQEKEKQPILWTEVMQWEKVK